MAWTQLLYINTKVEEAVDAILKRSKTPPIIILHFMRVAPEELP